MNPLIDAFAWWWIGPPSHKYKASERYWGDRWRRPFTQALAAKGIRLNHVGGLQDILDAFKGYYWIPDPLWQALDVIYPPYEMLMRGGGDCDEWAWLHALAIKHALGDEGWRAAIVSTFCDPFVYSHHFAVAISPQGEYRAIQPRPSKQQPPDLNPLMPDIYGSYRETALAITASYQKPRLIWYDVRDTLWREVEGPVRP